MNRAASQNWKQRLKDFFIGDSDALTMRVFECAFTITFLMWMSRCFSYWREWLTDDGFHLTAAELASMAYPDPWQSLWPWEVVIFAVAVYTAAGLLLLNLWHRGALITLFLCALFAQRVDFMAAFSLSKLYICIYAVLAVAPARWSQPETGRMMQSVAPQRVLQAALILHYFASGLAKAGRDWLVSHDVLWTQMQGVYRTEFAALALRKLPMWCWTVLQHCALLFEILSPLLFTLKILRPVAFIAGLGFHVMISLMMEHFFFFQSLMCSLYCLFISPERWRALGRWICRVGSLSAIERLVARGRKYWGR